MLSQKIRGFFPEYGLMVPITITICILIFIYQFIFGKLTLKFSNNRLDFEWKKRFLFDHKDIKYINAHEITTIIVDNGVFLRKIITKDGIIEINNTKPVNREFKSLLNKLCQIVKKSNGRVVDSDQFELEKGYRDSSFLIFITLLSFSVFFISRLWQFISFYSLVILLLPIYGYLHHVKIRVRKLRLLFAHNNFKLDEENINSYLVQIDMYNQDLPGDFFDKLLKLNTNGLFDLRISFDRKVYDDFEANIMILSKFYKMMICSNISRREVEKFANCLIEKSSVEHSVYLINVLLPTYWYPIIKKLQQEINTKLDSERSLLITDLLTLIVDIQEDVDDVKHGLTKAKRS